jgi:hypothetical protein
MKQISSVLEAKSTPENLKRSENADADDKVVYTRSPPSDKLKRTEDADADDRVVYTWLLLDEHRGFVTMVGEMISGSVLFDS